MNFRYWETLSPLVSRFLNQEKSEIEDAAKAIFASLENGGVWHLFGSGHSTLLVEESFHRAGGLVPVNPMTIVELSPFVNPAKNREAERREGFTSNLVEKHGVVAGEILWIVSNSGINPSSIDMAMAARASGLKIWAVTCVEHSKAAKSRHSSGKRLFEIADHVLDTILPPGDAIVESKGDGNTYRNGAASLVMGSVLLHTVETKVIEHFMNAGKSPPIYMSSNLPGGDAHNKTLEAKYAPRVMRLRD